MRDYLRVFSLNKRDLQTFFYDGDAFPRRTGYLMVIGCLRIYSRDYSVLDFYKKLFSSVLVIKPDNIILFKVFTQLDFNDFKGYNARIF